MDDTSLKKNKFQQFYASTRTSFFNIMFELLKEKNTGLFLGCFIIIVMFVQLIGLLFEPEKFAWKDQFFLNPVVTICSYCRVIKAINDAQSLFFYWALMFFGIFYLLAIMALLLYMNFFLKNRKHYMEQVVKLLRVMFLLLFYIFYMPFFESFISIMNCEGGYHYLDRSMECYTGIHVFYFVLSIIFLILLFTNSIIIAMLYNETQPVQEDCLSRLESSFEVALVIYRSIVATFSNFCNSEVCSWVHISVYIISSGALCYSYYKQIPYYNRFVSILCGSLIFIYFWVSINALLMKLLVVNGHLVIIFIGIPFITLLVINLREKRIEGLMMTNMDKLKIDIDSLIQVHNMTDFSRGIEKDQAQRMAMIGIVNLHIDECQNSDCPCKEEYELYDIQTSKFSDRNRNSPHSDEVFLNHFIKRLYEDALNKFINSPSIHIAFAFYLFKVMKNIHASLVELNIAIKKKPSLQQQFTIFRYKNIIEEYIIQDHAEHKHVYPELTNVIEFERLFGEMQKSIEKVCNLQVEFWTHLTTVVPDLNILNELGKKIYDVSQETDQFWNQLCKINPNYQAALNIYGEYLREIRNHEHLGNNFLEKAFNTGNAKKSIDEHAKSSDILFSQDTTVIHISGNKESIGKILKTSQGLQTVFGYSKTEVIGHSINILMPTMFAKKHTDFMERFFRTGRQVIFYNERSLFATHRNGHCFQVKILVKQMPSLKEGIQYVGMLKPQASDFEYMITDMDGVIDSFTKGITGMLGLTPNLFKDKDSQINIQILAPELIAFFLETQQKGRPAKSRYRETGGDQITLIVPQNFHMICKSESKQNTRGGPSNQRTKGRGMSNANRGRSTIFKQFLKVLAKPRKFARDKMPTSKQILAQPEYIQCERKKEVQCEITCLEFKSSTPDVVKILVFKFSKSEKNPEKNKSNDHLTQYIYDMERQKKEDKMKNQTGYEEFKLPSLSDDGKEEAAKNQNQGNPNNLLIPLSNQNSYHQKRQNSYQARDNGSLTTGLVPVQESNKKVAFQPEPMSSIEHEVNNKQVTHRSNHSKIGSQTNSKDNITTGKSSGKLMNNNIQGGSGNVVHFSIRDVQQHQSQVESGYFPKHEVMGSISNVGGMSGITVRSEHHDYNNNPHSKSKQSVHSILEDKQEESLGTSQDDEDDDEEDESNKQSKHSKDQSIKQQKSSKYQQSQNQPSSNQIQDNEVNNAINDEDEGNQSDVETPRIDLSGIKLESAQKEKTSFLEELKKQSFVLSESNSTQKIDAKDSLDISKNNMQRRSQNANNSGQDGNNGSGDKRNDTRSLQSLTILLDPDQMVKKQNLNNINKIFSGDAFEPQDTIVEEIQSNNNNSDNENNNSQHSEENQTNSNNMMEDKRGGRVSNRVQAKSQQSKSKTSQKSAKSKSSKKKSDKSSMSHSKSDYENNGHQGKDQNEESGEDDEDREEEQMSSSSSSSDLKSSITHSSEKRDSADAPPTDRHSSREKQPLLGGNVSSFKPSQFSRNQMPNIDDVKRNLGGSPSKGPHADSDDENKGFSNQQANNPYFMKVQPMQPPDYLQANQYPANRGGMGGNNTEDDDDSNNGNNRGMRRGKYMKRDTNRIKTNPKYRCLDEGSEDENAVSKTNIDDNGQQSSKEVQFRENFLKFERRKKRKEKKQREKELKKIKALNGEDGSNISVSLEEAGGRSTGGGTSTGDEDDESSSSSSSSSSSEESKELTNQRKAKGSANALSAAAKKKKEKNVSEKNDDGEISSITTRQNKTERYHYILRMAIDEKYVPSSISNIRFAAYFIFMILIVIAIVFYVIQTQLFDKMSQDITNIHNSEQRLNYIIDITLSTRTLVMANAGMLNYSKTDLATLVASTQADLQTSATTLKDAQADLSLQTSSIVSDQLEQINPSDVQLVVKSYPNMPSFYDYTIWEAIMELVVSAYKLATSKLTDITDSNPTVYFIMQNCLNSVYEALKNSTDAIIQESNDNQNNNLNIFLYLLITASCALTFSLLFLIPVINKVTKSKQEVIKLFTLKAIEKHIDDQLKVCRNFINTKLQQNNEQGDHMDDNGDDMNVNDKELQNELNNNKYLKRIKKKNKGKKMKELSTNFSSTLLKFVLFLCIIEGYFLATFLLSQKFITNVQSLTEELQLLISRQPVQSFLLLIQEEMIYSNGTALIEGTPSITYVSNYQNSLYDQEEMLLDQFSQNYDIHSSSYNDDFNNIIYSDVCQYVTFANQTTCENFNQGILQKGIYSSVIKYWDFIRQLNHDFLESDRTNATIMTFLNDQRLLTAQTMQNYYFKISLSLLVEQLEADIQNFFDVEFIQNRTIFIVYMIYIVILYLFIWRKFMQIMSNELWRTKTMLSVLPTKVCFEVKEIREVIQKNSSNDFISHKM